MKDFHQSTLEETFEAVHSGQGGLTGEEAAKRLKDYGPNRLPAGKIDGYPTIFFRQFQSPLIYILLLACIVVLIIGETLDAVIILAVLVFNAIVGTAQEGKAQNTLLALKNFTDTKATVLREERELVIPDNEVVPGDVLILREGEKVSADARIIRATNLKVNEAALTGESEPIQKTFETPGSLLYKGTNILTGSGWAVVTSTGVDTVIGQISKEIATIDTEMPLKTNIRYLSRLIIIIVFSLSVILFIIGLLVGNSAKEMFGTVISLAVSVIPEGLPIVMTLVLATGVWRMSKRHALVKKLQAVEALGQAQVIAVDKTGTITRNEMVVQRVYLHKDHERKPDFFEVGGLGYEPKGEIKLNGQVVDVANHQDLVFAGKVGVFCANARVFFSEEEVAWRVAGDPTEAAMLVLGQKLGFHKDNLERESPLVAEIPFDYRFKYHATVHKVEGQNLLTVAGAPEEIIKLSNLTTTEKNKLEKVFQRMSSDGLRVIALAVKPKFSQVLNTTAINDLAFIGFVGLKDALRTEVAEAMKSAISAGIRVVMITGDHRVTAEAIAREAGIFHVGDLVLTGEDIDNFSESELSVKLAKTSIFARVTPEHKLRIIKAYRARGEIVAMTGDGVNDAPSLVAADLGVAMGRIGTEVAKEASDIVLTDDNFGSIIGAVEEGRNIYNTLKKVILYLFSTSWGEVMTIAGALLLGFPLPLLPAQIIWLNFVTDGFLDVSLAMEPKEEGLLQRKFERPKKYIVDKMMARRMFFMAIPMTLGTLILFSFYFENSLIKGWTITLTTLAVFQWFNAWNCRHESKSIFQMNPFTNKFLCGATLIVISLQFFMIYNPMMQRLFKTTALSLSEWGIVVLVGSSILWVEEIRKMFFRRKMKSRIVTIKAG